MTAAFAAFGQGLAEGFGIVAAFGLSILIVAHIIRQFVAKPPPAKPWWVWF